MRIADFAMYSDLLKRKSGMLLTADKSFLLDSRLTPVAKKWGFASLEAMTGVMRGVPDAALVKDVIEAMTMTETAFFRDDVPFKEFAQVALPYLAKKRGKNREIRIWSAACSSGQEPYSLAVTLLENQHLFPNWPLKILATDISEAALEKGRNGDYSQFEAQRGIPINILLKYFEQKDGYWGAKPEVREMVTFENFNLLNDMGPFGEFDAIFCRNVLTYFDEPLKKDVLSRLSRQLHPDGFLLLGKSETPEGSAGFVPLETAQGIYVLSEGKAARGPAAAG